MAHSFGTTSTTDDVLQGIDLSAKRVLVTGVSAGLGVETARVLAAHGAEVVGAARDLSKAETATAARSFKVLRIGLRSYRMVVRTSERRRLRWLPRGDVPRRPDRSRSGIRR